MKKLSKSYFGSRSRIAGLAFSCLIQSPGVLAAESLKSSPSSSFNRQATQANLSAVIAKPILLKVGNKTDAVTSSTKLTAAEFAAVNQVLQTGKQSLVISSSGAAIGGYLNLSAIGGNGNGSSLVIPARVTALFNLSTTNTLKLSGSLINYGNLYAYSTNGVRSGSITANAIFNGPHGLISTALPLALSAQLHASRTPVDLQLQSEGLLNNLGTISSSGSLTLQANNIRNSGQIASSNNITINTVAPANALAINSTGGSIRAQNNINIGGGSVEQSIVLTGGNYFSRQLNVDAGSGTIAGGIGAVSGTVNLTAKAADLGAATPLLKLGKLNVSGDPTYFNSQGSLQITSDIRSNGQDLALLASGDIIVSNSATVTTYLNTNGVSSWGNLTIVAGASLSTSDGSNSGSANSTTSVTINGPSATGGAIDLSGSSVISGQNLLMVAYAGPGAGNGETAGTVNLNNLHGISSNQNLTIIAGATSVPTGQSSIVQPTSTAFYYSFGPMSMSAATPTGTITVQTGSITSGALTAGVLQNVDLGSSSAPIDNEIIRTASSLSVSTAGNVFRLIA